jgi:hypothetical protein
VKTSWFLLSLALMGCGLFSSPAPNVPQPKAPVDRGVEGAFEAWVASDLVWCDARALGAVWGIDDMYETKTRVGGFLARGERDTLMRELENARIQADLAKEAVCPWHELSYHYDDMEKLGEYWGIPVWDAKTKAARHASAGRRQLVDEALEIAAATAAAIDVHGDPEHDLQHEELTVEYCDAKLLAAGWSLDLREAKVQLATKLEMLGMEQVIWALDDARSNVLKETTEPVCAFHETVFKISDAEVLAHAWGTDLSDTKTKIATKVFHGQRDDLRTQLTAARQHVE